MNKHESRGKSDKHGDMTREIKDNKTRRQTKTRGTDDKAETKPRNRLDTRRELHCSLLHTPSSQVSVLYQQHWPYIYLVSD